MKSFTRSKTLHTCIAFIVSFIAVNAEEFAVHNSTSFTRAKKLCESEHASKQQYNITEFMDSSNINATWISERLFYSELVHLETCLPLDGFRHIDRTKMTNNSIYSCSRQCRKGGYWNTEMGKQNYRYFGLSGAACYCTLEIVPTEQSNRVPDSSCSDACPSDLVMSNCGSEHFIAVYKVFENVKTADITTSHPENQCRAVLYSKGNVRYQLQSCKYAQNAFACFDPKRFNKNASELSNYVYECALLFGRTICNFKSAASWERAKNVCMSIDAQFLGFPEEALKQSILSTDTWYWTPAFRTSSVRRPCSGSTDDDGECLVLESNNKTRVQNCSKSSTYICRNVLSPITSEENKSSTQLWPVLVVVIVFVLVLCFVLCLFKTRLYGKNCHCYKRPGESIHSTEQFVDKKAQEDFSHVNLAFDSTNEEERTQNKPHARAHERFNYDLASIPPGEGAIYPPDNALTTEFR